MINTYEAARWILLSTALAAATLSAMAFAEYRCGTPQRLTNAEVRACELAQQDSPAALIRFVNRTKAIYNLYADDYASPADGARWELTERGGAQDPAAIAKAKSDAKDALKAQ